MRSAANNRLYKTNFKPLRALQLASKQAKPRGANKLSKRETEKRLFLLFHFPLLQRNMNTCSCLSLHSRCHRKSGYQSKKLRLGSTFINNQYNFVKVKKRWESACQAPPQKKICHTSLYHTSKHFQ